MEDLLTLKIGEYHKIKLSFMKSLQLIYCGMPTDKTYSIGICKEAGYQGYGHNLYFPRDTKQITLESIDFEIHSITPTTITLRQKQPITYD